MKITLCISLLLLQLTAFSQLKIIPNQIVILQAGPSLHGSGDLPGFNYNVDYSRNFKKRMYYSIGIGGSIHSGQDQLLFTTPDGEEHDGSIRSTTAGVQVVTGLGFNIIRNHRHDFSIRPGILFRYQSSSHYDDVSVFYPAATGMPFPVIVYNHEEPQNSFAAGFNLQLAYNFFNLKNYSVGILGAFQFDTNGDIIRSAGISLGKRF